MTPAPSDEVCARLLLEGMPGMIGGLLDVDEADPDEILAVPPEEQLDRDEPWTDDSDATDGGVVPEIDPDVLGLDDPGEYMPAPGST